MPVDFTAPTGRVLLPFVYASHRSGRWVGVICFQSEEHRTPKCFGTRAAALADAKRLAATLVRTDIEGAQS